MTQIAPYQQASDPGAVGAGVEWTNTTTGDVYRRDITNSAWNKMFNVGVVNGGLLPLAGGNMTGAITGSHGLAPLDSPAFTTNATLTSNDLATKAFVTNLLTGYQPLA